MWGLTQREILKASRSETFFDTFSDPFFDGRLFLRPVAPDTNQYVDLLLGSGFPEALTRTTERTRLAWLDFYVDPLVGRDVKLVGEVQDLATRDDARTIPRRNASPASRRATRDQPSPGTTPRSRRGHRGQGWHDRGPPRRTKPHFAPRSVGHVGLSLRHRVSHREAHSKNWRTNLGGTDLRTLELDPSRRRPSP